MSVAEVLLFMLVHLHLLAYFKAYSIDNWKSGKKNFVCKCKTTFFNGNIYSPENELLTGNPPEKMHWPAAHKAH